MKTALCKHEYDRKTMYWGVATVLALEALVLGGAVPDGYLAAVPGIIAAFVAAARRQPRAMVGER